MFFKAYCKAKKTTSKTVFDKNKLLELGLHIFVHECAELSYISVDCTCIIPLYIYPWGGKVENLKVSCVNLKL